MKNSTFNFLAVIGLIISGICSMVALMPSNPKPLFYYGGVCCPCILNEETKTVTVMGSEGEVIKIHGVSTIEEVKELFKEK